MKTAHHLDDDDEYIYIYCISTWIKDYPIFTA